MKKKRKVTLSIYIDADTKRRLVKWAYLAGRSVSNEVVFILKSKLNERYKQ